MASVTDFWANAVRTYASASLSASFRLCLFVFFEFGMAPESRVNRGSGFLWGGEVYSGGGVRKSVVCRNLGLFGQRSSV